MSNEEVFEELDLADTTTDITLDKSPSIQKEDLSIIQSHSEIESSNAHYDCSSKFYNDFMESNREFFERIGFRDITSDPIFTLEREIEKRAENNMNPYSSKLNSNSSSKSCYTCKNEISRIFTKDKYCKFCGFILCDKCCNILRKLPKSQDTKLHTICLNCENKFLNLQTHEEFKVTLTNKEFEISDNNQKLEKLALVYSESLDEINKLNERLVKKRRENETKEEIVKVEVQNLKKRTQEQSQFSSVTTIKINESINLLKHLDEKKNSIEQDYKQIQKDRETITYEYEKKQSHHDEVLAKINKLSISMKNQQQEVGKRQTGNKQLDMLLKEKMRSQSKILSHTSQSVNTTIILNPSKVVKEVYKEPLLGEKKEGMFKRFIMFMGSKIFIK